MKSVKPGRGPSMMSGIGGIVAGVFGIIWIVAANSMGAPGFFTAFGVVFVLIAVASAVYNLMNTVKKNRFSSFDITDDREEPDPLNRQFGDAEASSSQTESGNAAFCPYCGEKVEDGYRYCRRCGKELPHS